MNELQNLLVSGKPLWITKDGFRQAMLSVFPLNGKVNEKLEQKPTLEFSKTKEEDYLKDHTWYQFLTHASLHELTKMLAQDCQTSEVTLTDEFANEQLPDNSIAYHRIFGTVMAESLLVFL